MSHDSHEHHLMSLKTHLKVFGTLLILTFLTVFAAQFDFGSLNVAIALLIATVKATIVMAFFMHLKYDEKINTWIFATSFFGLVTFAAFAFLDIFTRIDPRL